MTYSYTDPDGDRLEIVPSAGAAVRLVATDVTDDARTCITVLVRDFGKVVAAMYEAAGLPAPVVLRPDEIANDWIRHPKRGEAVRDAS